VKRIRAVQPDRTLRSWKEISGYLEVSVRTAQAWEKQSGLPVHRLPGGSKAGVYAQTAELDRWYKSSEVESKVERATPKRIEPKPVPRFANRGWLLLVPLVSLVVAVAILGTLTRPVQVTSVELRGTLLMALSGQGTTLWSLNYPELDVLSYGSARDWPQAEDLDSDGVKEILFNYRRKGSALPGDSKMICLNSDGSVRWEFPYGRRKKWGSRELAPLYSGYGYAVIRDAKNCCVMTVAKQEPYFPAQVAFLDPKDGKPFWEYWHPGHLSQILCRDLDGDSVEEILLGGMNNPGPGLGYPALVVLKSPFRSTLPAAESWVSPDSWGGNEFAYLLFPRTDISEVLGIMSEVQWLRARTDGVTVGAGMPPQAGLCAGSVYVLNFGLEVESLRELDCFRTTHDYLASEGKLDHPLSKAELDGLTRVLRFKTAPDANSPEVARMWAALAAK
jgi:hypothetical protein